MKFRWIGGATFLLELGPFHILGDPVFVSEWTTDWLPTTGAAGQIRRLGPVPKVDLNAVNLVLVSHTHTDHFQVTPGKQLSADVPVVVPAAQAAVVETAGFRDVAGLDRGRTNPGRKGRARCG